MECVIGVFAAVCEVSSAVYEFHKLCVAIGKHVQTFRGNRHELKFFENELSAAYKQMDLCKRKLEEYCRAYPTRSAENEQINLERIGNILDLVDSNISKVTRNLSDQRSCLSCIKEFMGANKIARNIQVHSKKVERVREELNDLIDKNDLRKEELEIKFSKADFCSTPNARTSVFLNFYNEATVEGKLKIEILKHVKQQNRPQKVRSMNNIIGVIGVEGVGKTTTLLALAQDPDVQAAFPDGIYFIDVGRGADDAKLVNELKGAVWSSGGKRLAQKKDMNESLDSASSAASLWFSNRKALFICDDIWETSSSGSSYYNQLVELLEFSPNSLMIVSTSDEKVGSRLYKKVVFEPRNATGPEARGMFLARAGITEENITQYACDGLVDEILELCGGIPLTLSISGAITRVNGKSGIGNILEHLKNSLQKKSHDLLSNSSFVEVVQTSLACIGEALNSDESFLRRFIPNYLKRKEQTGPGVQFVSYDMISYYFHKLSSLLKSGSVSESVIFAMLGVSREDVGWKLLNSFVDYELVSNFKSAYTGSAFHLHNLVLDCGMQKSSRTNDYHRHQREFLCNAWNFCDHKSNGKLSKYQSEKMGHWEPQDNFWSPDARSSLRPWWLIGTHGSSGVGSYLVDNVVKHLIEAERLAEAVELLSRMEWIQVRMNRGGLAAVNSDFDVVEKAMVTGSDICGEHDRQACNDVQTSLKHIRETINKSWFTISKHPDSLSTHSFGYLLREKDRYPVIKKYLQSAQKLATSPWLQTPFSNTARPADKPRRIEELNSIDLVRLLEEHDDCVRSVAMNANGRTIVSGSSGKTVRVWNANRTDVVKALQGHDEHWVSSVAISADGQTVVSGSEDSAVRVWDARSGMAVGRPLSGHQKVVSSVSLSADGRIVVSGSWDKTVRVWNTRSCRAVGNALQGHQDLVTSVAISADGRLVVSGSWDRTVRVWDIESGLPVGEPLCGHDDSVTSVAMSADGKSVVSGSYDKTVLVWDIASGTAVCEPLRGHDAWVTSVAMSADGRLVVSGSYDRTVRVWNVQTGKALGEPLRGHEDWLRSVAMSADGRTVMSSSDDTVRVWDLNF